MTEELKGVIARVRSKNEMWTRSRILRNPDGRKDFCMTLTATRSAISKLQERNYEKNIQA